MAFFVIWKKIAWNIDFDGSRGFGFEIWPLFGGTLLRDMFLRLTPPRKFQIAAIQK